MNPSVLFHSRMDNQSLYFNIAETVLRICSAR